MRLCTCGSQAVKVLETILRYVDFQFNNTSLLSRQHIRKYLFRDLFPVRSPTDSRAITHTGRSRDARKSIHCLATSEKQPQTRDEDTRSFRLKRCSPNTQPPLAISYQARYLNKSSSNSRTTIYWRLRRLSLSGPQSSTNHRAYNVRCCSALRSQTSICFGSRQPQSLNGTPSSLPHPSPGLPALPHPRTWRQW